jgi:prophage DNA circulation protein
MPRTSLIAGAKAITFKGIDITRYVASWQDDRQPAVAIHEYLKRDGGEAEHMGRKPHKVKFSLAFVGASDIEAYKRLQKSIDEDPRGALVHPIHGSMRVCCQGFTGAGMDVENAVNLYNVPLEFIEDAVDTKATADERIGPAARENQVRTLNTQMLTIASRFAAAATAINTFSAAVLSYAVSAVSSALSTTPDPALPGELASLRTYCEDARAAVLADESDETANTDAAKYPALVAIEQVYDACTLLDDSVKELRPKLTVYTVPMTIPLMTLAAQFYKRDAQTRADEIRLNNPGKIKNPAAIPAGTQLLMATPTAE